MPRFWSIIICSLLVAGCGEEAKFRGTDITGAEYGAKLELTDHTGRERLGEDLADDLRTLLGS